MLDERKQRVLERLRDLAAQLQDALAESPEHAPQEESLCADPDQGRDLHWLSSRPPYKRQ